jgi:aspartyl protease family protein
MNDFPHALKIVTVWLLAGLLVFLGFEGWQSHAGRTRFTVQAGAIEIRRAPDGHYHWPGRVDGVAVDFLVDTGATSTALPQALADRLGLEAVGRVTSLTAGGRVQGTLARVDVELDGGIGAERLRVAVLPALGAPLLGMDVLGRMQFSQRDGVLRLEPATARP